MGIFSDYKNKILEMKIKITHNSITQINHCQLSLCIFFKDSFPCYSFKILRSYFMSLWYFNF